MWVGGWKARKKKDSLKGVWLLFHLDYSIVCVPFSQPESHLSLGLENGKLQGLQTPQWTWRQQPTQNRIPSKPMPNSFTHNVLRNIFIQYTFRFHWSLYQTTNGFHTASIHWLPLELHDHDKHSDTTLIHVHILILLQRPLSMFPITVQKLINHFWPSRNICTYFRCLYNAEVPCVFVYWLIREKEMSI